MRDFLPEPADGALSGRLDGPVDTVKKLQGWTDVSVMHFRDLGVYGEQILLSVRYGDWIDINDPAQAANWARYWRPEIQSYMHAYRAVTGVDLTTAATSEQTLSLRRTPPSVLLRQRLEGGAAPMLPAPAPVGGAQGFERGVLRRAVEHKSVILSVSEGSLSSSDESPQLTTTLPGGRPCSTSHQRSTWACGTRAGRCVRGTNSRPAHPPRWPQRRPGRATSPAGWRRSSAAIGPHWRLRPCISSGICSGCSAAMGSSSTWMPASTRSHAGASSEQRHGGCRCIPFPMMTSQHCAACCGKTETAVCVPSS